MDGLCYKCWMRRELCCSSGISCIEEGARPSGVGGPLVDCFLTEHSEISLQALAPDLSLGDKHLVALERPLVPPVCNAAPLCS